MKLSVKSEYAILALVYLSRHYDSGKLLSAQEIADSNDIPKKFLEQILLALKRGGFVKSFKGPNGGYKLGKQPDSICVAEIIRLMDGALAPVESVSQYFYEQTPIEKNEKMIAVFRDIRDYISDKLENITFKDLL